MSYSGLGIDLATPSGTTFSPSGSAAPGSGSTVQKSSSSGASAAGVPPSERDEIVRALRAAAFLQRALAVRASLRPTLRDAAGRDATLLTNAAAWLATLRPAANGLIASGPLLTILRSMLSSRPTLQALVDVQLRGGPLAPRMTAMTYDPAAAQRQRTAANAAAARAQAAARAYSAAQAAAAAAQRAAAANAAAESLRLQQANEAQQAAARRTADAAMKAAADAQTTSNQATADKNAVDAATNATADKTQPIPGAQPEPDGTVQCADGYYRDPTGECRFVDLQTSPIPDPGAIIDGGQVVLDEAARRAEELTNTNSVNSLMAWAQRNQIYIGGAAILAGSAWLLMRKPRTVTSNRRRPRRNRRRR